MPATRRASRPAAARTLSVAALLACLPAACHPTPAAVRSGATLAVAADGRDATDEERAGILALLAHDVRVLASAAYEGRATGTAGADSTALFLLRRYANLKLPGAFPGDCAAGASCPPTPLQLFRVNGDVARNVAVVVAGTDPALRGQVVIVGAHHDHVGWTRERVRDADRGPLLHPGADDNASGTAAVLELARRLAARPTRRTVLLAHFGAEELGLLGSGVFADHPPVPLDSVTLMVNLDMVGRLRDDQLYVYVSIRRGTLEARTDSLVAATGLRPTVRAATRGDSDHASFQRRGVPAMHLFTGLHADYHAATDVAERVDARGLARVVDAAEAIVRAAADRPDPSVR